MPRVALARAAAPRPDILLARSPGTVANLTHSPEVEVNFVDPFTRKGARLRGKARMVNRGAAGFDDLIARYRTIWGELSDRINMVVTIPVEAVRPLTTPPYDDGATEEEMIALYKSKYAEIYP